MTREEAAKLDELGQRLSSLETAFANIDKILQRLESKICNGITTRVTKLESQVEFIENADNSPRPVCRKAFLGLADEKVRAVVEQTKSAREWLKVWMPAICAIIAGACAVYAAAK